MQLGLHAPWVLQELGTNANPIPSKFGQELPGCHCSYSSHSCGPSHPSSLGASLLDAAAAAQTTAVGPSVPALLGAWEGLPALTGSEMPAPTAWLLPVVSAHSNLGAKSGLSSGAVTAHPGVYMLGRS